MTPSTAAIDESTYRRMPPHLQALLVKLPNPERDEVVGAFPDSKGGRYPEKRSTNSVFGKTSGGTQGAREMGGEGSAARFFYSAKASKADRAESKHPTVKPISLIEWFATLITPPGGVILDPFAGSGTTGAAAARGGFRCVLVEREAEYVEDIRRRFASPSIKC